MQTKDKRIMVPVEICGLTVSLGEMDVEKFLVRGIDVSGREFVINISPSEMKVINSLKKLRESGPTRILLEDKKSK